MPDITEKLEERAISYEQSGPSAHHTAALLREAKFEIERLRKALAEIADPNLALLAETKAAMARQALAR